MDLTLTQGVQAVAEQEPVAYVQFGRGLRDLELRKRSRDLLKYNANLQVTCYWGPTGSGKTRRVAALGDVYPLDLGDGGLWFDGYTGQKRLLIDEFYGQLKPAVLLKLIDKYTRSWPVKGGFVVGDWDEIYITSNIHPDGWYRDSVPSEVKAAIKRRIGTVEFIDYTTTADDPVTTTTGPEAVLEPSDNTTRGVVAPVTPTRSTIHVGTPNAPARPRRNRGLTGRDSRSHSSSSDAELGDIESADDGLNIDSYITVRRRTGRVHADVTPL